MTAPDDGVVDDVDDDDGDPFEAFNAAMGQGLVEDPYPQFAAERARAPISVLDVTPFGDEPDDARPQPGDAPTVMAAYGYDAVLAVLRDGDAFSSSGYGLVMGPVLGRSILEMDEPEHHVYRSLVQKAFTKNAMRRWETDLIRRVVDAHVDRFASRGRADLVRELTFPFPFEVIAGMLGLPDEDRPRFHRLGVEVVSVSVDYDRAVRASGLLRDYFATILEQRRRQPTDDIITVLAQAEHDGQRLTDEEIFAFLRLLLPAGAETTYRSSSNLLVGLLTNPDQLDAVRADRSLLPQAIEEGLRWEPPLLTIMRTATRDVDVCGVPVAAGTVVIVNMGSANRDESRWTDPDRFDIFREPRPHLAFAAGPHTCLGMHLARMETTVAVGTLIDRLPGLRLDPDAPPAAITGMTFRSPPSLPVVWDV